VARRSIASSTFFLALLLALMGPSAAVAQGPTFAFGHDDALDGTPQEIISGFFGGGDTVSDPTAQRIPQTFEFFDVTVPPAATGSFASFTVQLRWQDNRLDHDMYIYRQRPNGTFNPEPVASSAQGGTNEEEATVFNPLAATPLPPGTVFRIYVDNWCTRDADPNPTTPDPADTANCGIGEDVPDEDDFIGSVTFNGFTPDNQLPRVSISGPDTGETGQLLTFSASGTDDDGITNYAFDLDGDGRFETNAGRASTVAKRFDIPGTYNIGVRAIDGRNGAGFANRRITITGPPLDASGKPLIRVIPSRRLVRSFFADAPVFGGRRGKALSVRYRLKQQSTVDLRLMRGNRTVRRLVRNRSRAGGRTHRLTVRPRGLRRGVYTLRLVVRTSDGRRETLRIQARRL